MMNWTSIHSPGYHIAVTSHQYAQDAASRLHPRFQCGFNMMRIAEHVTDTWFEQGGEDTFASFPEHLKALIQHALPNIDVLTLTYPKFETRGELKECVDRFRTWSVLTLHTEDLWL